MVVGESVAVAVGAVVGVAVGEAVGTSVGVLAEHATRDMTSVPNISRAGISVRMAYVMRVFSDRLGSDFVVSVCHPSNSTPTPTTIRRPRPRSRTHYHTRLPRPRSGTHAGYGWRRAHDLKPGSRAPPQERPQETPPRVQWAMAYFEYRLGRGARAGANLAHERRPHAVARGSAICLLLSRLRGGACRGSCR